jgi:hypothetical protein
MMFIGLIKKRNRKEKKEKVRFVLAINYSIMLKKLKYYIKWRDYSVDEF